MRINGESKVGDFCRERKNDRICIVWDDEYVGWLDVTVNLATGVNVGQAARGTTKKPV